MKRILVLLSLLSIFVTGCGDQTPAGPDQASAQNITENLQEKAANPESTVKLQFDGYKVITVDGGDKAGTREPNVAVDIGYGDREYWGFTNEYGQLARVIAKEIILQDDNTEPVTSDGLYYSDEANVPAQNWLTTIRAML